MSTTADNTQPVTATEAGAPSQPPPKFLAAGELVAGRYRVDRLVGRGGYGEVYRVEDQQQGGRELALKLHRLRRLTRGALGALRSEFGLLSTMSHPNLATVHDFAFLENEYAFFTQTYIDGVPLHYAKLDPISERGVALLAQLCRALDYLHSRGIVHGDVKPGNILVDLANEHLTLLDFGVSRALGASAGVRVVGSPPYMAPELMTGGVIDARTDLYALGITIYQITTGRVPFKGTSTSVLMAHVEEAPPDLPHSVPVALRALIARLIAKDPADRPRSASAVLGDLARIAGVDVSIDTDETLASHVLSARIVGREKELWELSKRAARASPEDPPVLLGGGAGTGKSRLVRELRRRVQLRGQQWIQIETRGESGSDLLVRLARSVLGRREIEGLADEERIELARALPELRRPRERIAVPLDPDLATQRRLDVLGGKIAARFGWKPGVLVVEDLHWASAREREDLARLLASSRRAGAKCLFLLVSRDGEEHAELFGAHHISVRELEPPAARMLVGETFGDESALEGSGLASRIAASPCSPFWLQESLRLAIESRAIVRRGGRFERVEPIEAQPLSDVLEARFARLGAPARKLALGHAILAGACSGNELERAAGMKRSRAVEGIAELVRTGIVERQIDGQQRARYVLHDRYGEVAIASHSDARVTAARRRIGRWLAKRDAKEFRGLARAARELESAGDVEGAVAALERGAGLAELAGRPERAAALIARELELRSDDDPARAGRLVRVYDLATLSGLSDLSGEALMQLAALAMKANDPHLSLTVELRGARQALHDGSMGEARRHCEAALDQARERGFEELVCELSILSGRIEQMHGSVERCLERYREAAELARRLGRADLEATAELGCALVHVRQGYGPDSAAAAERAVRAAKKTDDPVLRSNTLRALGNAHYVAGRRRQALRTYRRAVRVARESGGTEAEAKALNNVASCAHTLGMVREALEAWRRAIVLKERVGAIASAMVTWASMSSVLQIIGHRAEAWDAQQRVIDHPRQDAHTALWNAWSNRGDLHVFAGDFGDALRCYAAASEGYREMGTNQLRTHALTGGIRTRLLRNHESEAEEIAEMLVQMGEIVAETDSPEGERRYLTTQAMVLDFQGETKAALKVARRAARLKRGDTIFEDGFGSRVEAKWMVALLLARLGHRERAERAARAAKELLLKRASVLEGDDREGFLERHPLHAAIVAQVLTTRPGTTW